MVGCDSGRSSWQLRTLHTHAGDGRQQRWLLVLSGMTVVTIRAQSKARSAEKSPGVILISGKLVPIFGHSFKKDFTSFNLTA
jgi:hypothetical protein